MADPIKTGAMKNVGRFQAAWDDYAARVIPRSGSPVQAKETRRAFYAGGAALFHTMLSVMDENEEPTEADLRALDELKAEFEEFTRALADGAA